MPIVQLMCDLFDSLLPDFWNQNFFGLRRLPIDHVLRCLEKVALGELRTGAILPFYSTEVAELVAAVASTQVRARKRR
jgi:hypothetical protein